MKIQDSTVAMAAVSQSKLMVKAKTMQFVQVGTVEQKPKKEEESKDMLPEEFAESVKENTEDSRKEAMRRLTPAPRSERISSGGTAQKRDYRIDLLRLMIKIWTGKDIKFQELEGMRGNSGEQSGPLRAAGNAAPAAQRGEVVFSSVTTTSVEVRGSEKVAFNALGSVTTEDGRTIDFDMSMFMSQEFYEKFEQTSVSEFKGTLCDPLVINFAAGTAGLSNDKFAFDLDCDGTPDQISRLLSGSGFLAYDKNGDGTINDGSELFGTKSGDGFKDLAAHDKDANGWIDENDEIFDKLRIWTVDENGKSSLVGLGELGIGALYLGNVSTNYSYGFGDAMNGMLRSTGVFLREDGTAGTMQHVDLAL